MLTDAGENLKRLYGDLGMGSVSTYKASNGEVIEKERRGLLGAMTDFGKNFATGISFGAYNPNKEEIPQGAGRVTYGFKKMFLDGVGGDLLGGVPSAAVHSAEDIALASLNAFETIPDSTIGNFSYGKKATTATFDGTQVLVNGVADSLPGGDAWARVYSGGTQRQTWYSCIQQRYCP